METLKARRAKSSEFKVLKDHGGQLRLINEAKLFATIKG